MNDGARKSLENVAKLCVCKNNANFKNSGSYIKDLYKYLDRSLGIKVVGKYNRVRMQRQTLRRMVEESEFAFRYVETINNIVTSEGISDWEFRKRTHCSKLMFRDLFFGRDKVRLTDYIVFAKSLGYTLVPSFEKD
jgi:hypothetical protein